MPVELNAGASLKARTSIITTEFVSRDGSELIGASHFGHFEAVEWLTERGIDVVVACKMLREAIDMHGRGEAVRPASIGYDVYVSSDDRDYLVFCAESEAEHEAEQITGLTRCDACGEWSAVRGSACTLGRPGHPGAEFSEYTECINPSCQKVVM